VRVVKIFELLEGLFRHRESGVTNLAVDGSDDLDIDPYNPFPEPVEIEIRDFIDLHTIPPREVKKVVEEYLSEARSKGFANVRIIHGKGIGVQREMVRAILARTPFVISWTDAPPDAGGLGATIARLGEPQEKVELSQENVSE
jgi:dsDNA-specific endonuclease/ATPase MutS2